MPTDAWTDERMMCHPHSTPQGIVAVRRQKIPVRYALCSSLTVLSLQQVLCFVGRNASSKTLYSDRRKSGVEASETNENMSSLPPALDFPAMETAIVAKWKEEDTFHTQDALSLERGDKVRILLIYLQWWSSAFLDSHQTRLLACRHIWCSALFLSAIFRSRPFSRPPLVRHVPRNSHFTMVLPLPRDCRITVTFWRVPSRIPSPVTRP
jgi:hypothetical protein